MSFSKLSSEILEKFGDLSNAKLNVPVLMNFVDFLRMLEHLRMFINVFQRKQAGGGEGGVIRPQTGSSLCCAQTVSSRKLKLSDF